MSLNYEFKKALSTITRLIPEDRNVLALICKDICQAEDDLKKKLKTYCGNASHRVAASAAAMSGWMKSSVFTILPTC